MRIAPITIFSNNKTGSNHKKASVSPVSFQAKISKADILKIGFVPISVQNSRLQTKADFVIIDSAEKFIALTNSPNMWNKTMVLTSDIDLKGAKIKPIGNSSIPFSGEFDGNGYKITNFKIVSDSDSYNVGLFGKCQSAILSNLDVENAYISGGQQIGGIAGWAQNTQFYDCLFKGYIRGEKNIGGLIGMSRNNEIRYGASVCTIDSVADDISDPFDLDEDINITGITGGLIGSDDSSEIKCSYSKSILRGDEQIGGFIGYALNSEIQNSTFNGTIIGNKKAGSMIGWAEHTNIRRSYALCNIDNYFGLGINNTASHVFNSLDELMKSKNSYWNSAVWHKSYDKLPRLVVKEQRMSAEELFIEDVNNDIKTKRIKKPNLSYDSSIYRFNLHPPVHFEENNETLNMIKNSSDESELFNLFGRLVEEMHEKRTFWGQDTSRYDELLLELIKNPNMDLNRTYLNGYNITCTPLFILTCLDEGYVLQEALKRDDVNVEIGSGFDGNQTVLRQAIEHHIDSCTYALLKEPKMAKYIKSDLNVFKSMDISPFARVLLESYPNIPEYNNDGGYIEFRKEVRIPEEFFEPLGEVKSIEDIQNMTEVDVNYCDSRGNNLANVALNLDGDREEDILKTLIASDMTGVDLNHMNNNSESPYGHAIYRAKGHVAGYLIPKTSNPYLRIDDGIDAMLLFSNMSDENAGLNYMEIARKKGLSVNSQAKDGSTPLMNAVNLKNYNAIRYLLEHGANPNIRDLYNQTPLHKACMNNDEKAIDMLLNAYAYPNVVDEPGLKPFDYLSGESKQKLQQKLEDISYFYKLANCEDITKSDNHICNVDYYNKIYSNDEFNKIQERLSGDEFNETILQLSKNIMLNPELKNMSDLEGNNILHLIAGVKSPYAKECIQLALDKGYDINKRNEYGETPLIKALDSYLCADSTEDRITLLQNIKAILDANPDVDITDNNKQGALHRICQSGSPLLLIEILRLNPKINQIDMQGLTPFDYIPEDTDNPMRQITNKYLEENNVIRRK